MLQKWYRLNYLPHVPLDAYKCQGMQYHELMTWFAPTEGYDALFVTPKLLGELKTLVTYYFPRHLNRNFGWPVKSRIRALIMNEKRLHLS